MRQMSFNLLKVNVKVFKIYFQTKETVKSYRAVITLKNMKVIMLEEHLDLKDLLMKNLREIHL